MTARLILVRHGPSAHTHTGALDRAGVQRWRDAYDAAGIRVAVQPPPALSEIAAGATHIIASDLRRAVESAERLAPQRQIRLSPLMREAPLAIPRWPTHLPLAAWDALMHTGWIYRRVRGADPTGPDWTRAAAAAQWLASIVADGTTALVVTHGVFRQLVATHLVRLGWRSAGRRSGYRHWSFWSFAVPMLPPSSTRDLSPLRHVHPPQPPNGEREEPAEHEH